MAYRIGDELVLDRVTPEIGAPIAVLTRASTGVVKSTGVDSTAKKGSNNFLTSGGVYSFVSDLIAAGAATGIPHASTTVYGIVKIGANIDVAAGVISVPLASTTVFGVVKIGSGITVAGGVISVAGGGATAAGANTQVQYNDAGNFGASANFTFNNGTNMMSVTSATITSLSGVGTRMVVANATGVLSTQAISGITGLTAPRVPFASSPTTLVDDPDMTFSGATLSVTNITVSTAITNSSLAGGGLRMVTVSNTGLFAAQAMPISGLTAPRVVFASSPTTLADDADMTFAVATLTVTNITVPTAIINTSLGGGGVRAVTVDNTGLLVAAPLTTVAGADTQVQFNDVGAFGASPLLTFIKATGALTATRLQATELIAGRLALVATGGFIGHDPDFTFSGDLLTTTRLNISGIPTGQVLIKGTIEVGYDSDLTFAGATLTATNITVPTNIVNTSLGAGGTRMVTVDNAGLFVAAPLPATALNLLVNRIPWADTTTHLAGDGPYWNAAFQRLGIGMVPVYDLEVQGVTNAVARIITVGTAEAMLRLERTSAGGGTVSDWRIYAPSGSVDLRFYSGGDRVTLTPAGKILIGTTTPVINGQVNAILQTAGTTGDGSSISLTRYAVGTNQPVLTFGKSRGATVGALGIVVSGDVLGDIDFAGDDGVDLATRGASILAVVDGAPAANSIPARLYFSTAAVGETLPSVRATITAAGKFLIGNTAITQVGAFNAAVQITGATGLSNDASLSIRRYGNNPSGPYLALGKSRAASIAALGLVLDADVAGQIDFAVDDGVDLVSRTASIISFVDGVAAADNTPGRLVFYTTASGSSSPVLRMAIDSLGNVGIANLPNFDFDIRKNNGTSPLVSRLRHDGTGDVIFYLYRVGPVSASWNMYLSSADSHLTFGNGNTPSIVPRATLATTGLWTVATLQATGMAAATSNRAVVVDLNGVLSATTTANISGTVTAGRIPYAVTDNVLGDGPFWVSASHRLLLGAATNLIVGNTNGRLQVMGLSADEAGISIRRYSASTGAGVFAFGKSRSATLNTNSIVLDNDGLGQIDFAGDDGVDIGTVAASILGLVDGPPSANIIPGRMEFYTASLAGANTRRMTIDSDGSVLIGLAASASAGAESRLQVTGSGTNTYSRLVGAGTGEVGFRIIRSGGTVADWLFYMAPGSTDLRYYDGTATRYTFTTAGLFTAANLKATGLAGTGNRAVVADSTGLLVALGGSFLTGTITPTRIPYAATSSTLADGPYWDVINQRLGVGGPSTGDDINVAKNSSSGISIGVSNSGTGNSIFNLVRSGGTVSVWSIMLPSGATDLRFATSAVDKFFFTTGAFLGIGVTPTYNLEVQGTTNAVARIITVGTAEAMLRLERTAAGGGTVTDWRLYAPAATTELRLFSGSDRYYFQTDGRMFASAAYGRKAHNTGHLEGGYANIGASGSNTNPIFTLGSSHNPALTTLGNMYGIGYTDANTATFLSAFDKGVNAWGMYVAALGVATIFFDANAGHMYSKKITVLKPDVGVNGYHRLTIDDGQGWSSLSASVGTALDGSGLPVRGSHMYQLEGGLSFIIYGPTTHAGFNASNGAIDSLADHFWFEDNRVPPYNRGIELQGVISSYSFTDASLVPKAYVDGLIGGGGSITSATYTPTVTILSNADAGTTVAYVWQYVRVGNFVTMSGQIDIDATAAGQAVVEINIPIASNFAANGREACGTGSNPGGPVVTILGNGTNDKLTFRYNAAGASGASATSFYCVVGYRVI